MKRIFALLTTLAVMATLRPIVAPTAHAQDDDTARLRDRALAAYDSTLDYASGRYVLDLVVATETTIATSDASFNSARRTHISGTQTFTVVGGNPNIASQLTVERVGSDTNSTTTSDTATPVAHTDTTRVEMRLVDDALYLNATIEAVEASDLVVPDGWRRVTDAFSTYDESTIYTLLPIPFNEIPFDLHFGFYGTTQTFENGRHMIENGATFRSAPLTDDDGAIIGDIITIEIPSDVFIARLQAQNDDPNVAELATDLYRDATLTYTLTLDAADQLMGGSFVLAVDFASDDLTRIGAPDGTVGTFRYESLTSRNVTYSGIGDTYPLAEVPAEAVPFS